MLSRRRMFLSHFRNLWRDDPSCMQKPLCQVFMRKTLTTSHNDNSPTVQDQLGCSHVLVFQGVLIPKDSICKRIFLPTLESQSSFINNLIPFSFPLWFHHACVLWVRFKPEKTGFSRIPSIASTVTYSRFVSIPFSYINIKDNTLER